MLNPSSLSQRKVSEEDSSGSEAGSDVSLEPETDRFGFIVTNGSTAGSVGPSPELVRQREAKWINIIGQWDRILMKKSSKVKVQCQKGIPASLRAKCWPLLCGASERMKQNNELYKCLDSQPGLQSWVDIIERDLDRQFPFHEMFLSKDGHGQQGLFRVLKAYTQYQPQEGYCQAQGPVAAVLLMNMPAEEAFWCLVQISEQYLPGYYNPLLEGVLFDAALLTWALKKMCPAVHKHLQHHGVEPLMFATDWLMCLFTRHLPFNTLLRVWDLFFCYGVRVLLQVAVVLVRRALGRPDQRKKCQGQVETLEILRGIRDQIQDEDDAFIAEVCSVPLSAKDLDKRMEKELQKWRNDRPSSTFDPRGRCQGYRMAWATVRQSQEEQDRKERETGNLSVPLARSASTLSLSPSLLHKRWRKGSKVNISEGDGGRRVVRHLSMGAKEDWRSWTDLKVQDVHEEEDMVSEGHKAESESTVKTQTEQKKSMKETEKTAENLFSEPAVKIVINKEQVESVEIRLPEKEESELKETEKSKEKTFTHPIKNQDGDEDNPTAETSYCGPEEEIDTESQFQVLEQKNHECSDTEAEVKDTNKKTEKQEAENEPAAEDEDSETPEGAHEGTNTGVVMQESGSSSKEQVMQADMKPQEGTETRHLLEGQTDSVAEVSKTETRLDSKTNEDGIESTDKKPPKKMETQQEHEEVITEKELDLSKEKYQSSESLEEPQEAESHTQTKAGTYELEQTEEQTENNAAMQETLMAEITPADSEKHSKTQGESLLSSSEAIQEKQDSDFQNDGEIEAELLDVKDKMKEPNEAKAGTSEPEKQVIILTEHSDILTESESPACEKSVTEETPKEAQAADSVKPTQQEETLTQSIRVDLVDTPELEAPEEPMSEVALSSATEEESLQEGPAGESNALTCGEATDGPIPDNSPQSQDKDAQSMDRIPSNTHAQDKDGQSMDPVPSNTHAQDKDAQSMDPIPDNSPQSQDKDAQSMDPIPDNSPQSQDKDAQSVDPIPSNTHAQDKDAQSMDLVPNSTDSQDKDAQSVGPIPANSPQSQDKGAQSMGPIPDNSPQSQDKDAQSVDPIPNSTDSQDKDAQSVDPIPDNGPQSQDRSAQSVGPIPDNSPHTQDKDAQSKKEQSECSNNSSVQASGHHSSRFSGDFCVRKPSSSRGSKLTRRLSEDLFTSPQKKTQTEIIPNPVASKTTPAAGNVTKTAPDVTLPTEDVTAQEKPLPQPGTQKSLGLFSRLIRKQPGNTKKKGTPKMQVPKILIQDFSDYTEAEKPVEEGVKEKLTSKERRKIRRERERREKDEERLKKKKEKDEKERAQERRKPQTRGKSFQVQKEKDKNDATPKTKTDSKMPKFSATYAEAYF
ncbi:titin homolog [Salarias fasciatus]|uniref:Titin homolog n=1 Tax=Salarias fasciatus TaxID=181472 RepID=A0A672IWP6_SALFA|nr:titin homolog [Salarias fasciatus]XP_029964780.1 titin homolog [Salarias fasciatus]